MHKKIIFFLIIFLFIIYSLLAILAVDNIYDAFDLNCGAIAKNIIDGTGLPVAFFLWPTYRGQLLVSFLTVPIFLILGDSFFSLKVVAFLLASLMLFLLYRLTARFFNKKVALAVSLLFIFPNQFLLQQLMSTCGQHAISILFILITFYYFYCLLDQEKSIPKYLFLLGLSSGLGISTSFNFLSTFFLIIFLLALIVKEAFFSRKLLFFSLGLFLGLLPLIILRLNQVDILDIQNRPLFTHFSYPDILNICKRFIKIAGPALKNSLRYSDLFFLSGKTITSLLYYLFLLGSLGTTFSAFMNKKSPKQLIKELMIPLFLLFYIFIYALSNLQINLATNYDEARFLTVLHPFLYLVIFTWCSKFESKPIVQKFNKALLVLLIISGISTQFQLIEWRDLKRNLRYKGFAFFGVMNLKKDTYLKPALENLKNLDPLIRLDIIQKMLTAFKLRHMSTDYYSLLQKYLDKKDLAFFIDCQLSSEISNTVAEYSKGTINIINNLDSPYLSYAYSVIGEKSAYKNKGGQKITNFLQKNEEVLHFIESLPLQAKAGYLEGFGRALGADIFTDKDTTTLLASYIEDGQKKNFYKGLGESFIFKPGPGFHADQIEKKATLLIERSLLPYFFEGIGRSILKTYLWDSNKCLNELDRLSRENRKYAYKGLIEGLRLFFPNKESLLIWLRYLNADDKDLILSLYERNELN